MSTLEMIVEELKSLPSEKLEVAAQYVHQLKEASFSERRSVLERLAGSWTAEEADAMEQTLKDCRKIDPREW